MAQQTFEELVAAVKQAESRDKRYKDDGKTLTTSAKGALGEMQVMPKTIRDPGFGVTPARDKSPDEIARVGVDYLQAMKQKYGDTEKALIAYNWGPGSTDKWLASGADPKKLPAETRTYVERVKGFLGKDVPRETSVAKKEREPLPPSLPPMAQAPSVKPEAAARVASLGPGYQAALALSFLADTDDEEDRKTTITQEYLAKAQEDEDDQAATAAIAKRQANVFADLSNTTIRSPFAQPQQPVRMKDGGEVSEDENISKPYLGNPNISRQVGQARRNAAIQKASYVDDLAEAKDTARKGEAYQELEQYLQSRNAVPDIKVTGYLPEGTHGLFSSDRTNVATGTIKVNKNVPEMFMPSTIAHEMTHAADRQMMQQAKEQGMFGNSNQFTEAYEKMVGKEGRNRTQLLRKRYPEFEEDNRYYRADPKELVAHAIGAYSGPAMQDRAPRHVDATAATELRILMDLAQRNVDKGPKGLAKIPAFFKRIGSYADGGDVEQERLTMQQIERLAAQEAAEREAASTPAFITSKSGIGRKAGPVSQAFQSGQGPIEFLKGMTNIPQNLVGGAFDLSNMVAGIYGGNVKKPFMGSDYIKEELQKKGLGFKPSEDPTLAAFYGAGDLGSNLVNPAGVTRSGVQAAGKASDLLTNFKAGRAEQPGGMVDLMTGQRVEPPILTPEQQAEQRTVQAMFDNLAGVNQERIAEDVAAGRLPAYLAPEANPQLTPAQIQAQNIARLPQDAQEQLRLFEEAATRPRPVAIRSQGPRPEIVQPPPATVAITQPATKLPPPPPFVAPPVSAEFPFVGRLDEFAAGMKGPAQKEQLINQVKGKFREQDVARLEDALADLGPKDKVTPAMLQDALANTYPPSRYRSVEIPATSPMYQDVDNVFSQNKQITGSMNLYLKESPESLALYDNYLAVKGAAQKAFRSTTPEEINLALDSLKNNPLSNTVPEINVLIDRVEEALPTITRFGKMKQDLSEIETLFLYPVIYKENGFSFFPEAHRRTVLIGQNMDTAQYMRTKYDILKQEEAKLIEELMQKGSDKLVALGGNPVDVKAFMQRHANDPDNLYHAGGKDNILKEHIQNNVTPINEGVDAALTRVKENIVNVYQKVDEKLQPYTGYAGRHRAVTGGDNMPIGFSRFTEHTVDIDGRQLKGRHVHELQSDLSKDVKELGPKSGSLEKDQRELDNLLAKETKLTQEQTALATQINATPNDDPLLNKRAQDFLTVNAEIIKLNQRKNVLENRVLGPKSTEAPFERDITKRKSIYVLEEPFANFEAAPAVEMQLLIKNAIQSSIRAGQDFVTFPGKESKQAQLYEKLLPNLKQAVKDLGGEKAGFEIKPITLPNPTGDSPTVYGVIWSPDTAAKAIEKGVPFNKGGMVERQPNDNRRYM